MIRVGLFAIVVLSTGCGRGRGGPTDAGPEAQAPSQDAGLPETIVIILDAGDDPGQIRPKGKVELISGLPRPCQDRRLGTVSFVQEDERIAITSSKTRARADCSRKDVATLLCDWVGENGKPALTQQAIAIGAGKKIGGPYEKGRRFSCAPQ
jgi:hypothetical protein